MNVEVTVFFWCRLSCKSERFHWDWEGRFAGTSHLQYWNLRVKQLSNRTNRVIVWCASRLDNCCLSQTIGCRTHGLMQKAVKFVTLQPSFCVTVTADLSLALSSSIFFVVVNGSKQCLRWNKPWINHEVPAPSFEFRVIGSLYGCGLQRSEVTPMNLKEWRIYALHQSWRVCL